MCHNKTSYLCQKELVVCPV